MAETFLRTGVTDLKFVIRFNNNFSIVFLFHPYESEVSNFKSLLKKVLVDIFNKPKKINKFFFSRVNCLLEDNFNFTIFYLSLFQSEIESNSRNKIKVKIKKRNKSKISIII